MINHSPAHSTQPATPITLHHKELYVKKQIDTGSFWKNAYGNES